MMNSIHPNSAADLLSARRLSDQEVASAAAILLALRRGESEEPTFPTGLIPTNTPDVQRIIDTVSAGIDRPVHGWKTYTVAKNLNPPFVCPIYDVFPSGSVIPAELSPERLIEPEIMFVVDRAIPAQDHNYSIAEIMDSVTAVVGYEVLASRFPPVVPFGTRHPYASFADHIGNGCIVTGDRIPDWQSVEFEDVSLSVTEDDEVLESGIVGAHPFDNPFLSVVMCVNQVRRRAGFNVGDVIVTSATASFFPIRSGTIVTSVYEGVGQVTATLT